MWVQLLLSRAWWSKVAAHALPPSHARRRRRIDASTHRYCLIQLHSFSYPAIALSQSIHRRARDAMEYEYNEAIEIDNLLNDDAAPLLLRAPPARICLAAMPYTPPRDQRRRSRRGLPRAVRVGAAVFCLGAGARHDSAGSPEPQGSELCGQCTAAILGRTLTPLEVHATRRNPVSAQRRDGKQGVARGAAQGLEGTFHVQLDEGSRSAR